MGNNKEALFDFILADELDPYNVWILTRGNVKISLGDLKGALINLNMANQLNPNDARTLTTRRQITKILEDF